MGILERTLNGMHAFGSTKVVTLQKVYSETCVLTADLRLPTVVNILGVALHVGMQMEWLLQ